MNFNPILFEMLANADRVAMLTGAGVSAESGIATFRDPDGLWSRFSPRELASVDGFMTNSKRVWEWYQYRRKMIDEAKYNEGHKAIAMMEEIFPSFTLITQNVDRLHQQAGSKDVIELHGNIIENKCLDCSLPFEGETELPDGRVPVCPACGGKIRPNVVWFGEMLPEDALKRADIISRECDVFFSVGTSAEVYPAANIPLQAKMTGAYLIEVNPNPTAISSYANTCIRATSAEALPELIRQYKEFLKERN